MTPVGSSSVPGAVTAAPRAKTGGDVPAANALLTIYGNLPPGADGTVPVADSTQPLGFRWTTGLASPLTTKGDLWGFGAADTRVPAGADGRSLVADSTAANGIAWKLVPACNVRSSATSVPNTTTVFPLFNIEDLDTDNMHDPVTNTDRVTVVTPGIYIAQGSLDWNENVGAGYAECGIHFYTGPGQATELTRYNHVARFSGAGDTWQSSPIYIVNAAAGDYFRVSAYQNSGGTRTLGTGTMLEVARMGSGT